jgi:hypothetical protein
MASLMLHLWRALGEHALSYALVACPAYYLLVGRGLAAISRTRAWPFMIVAAGSVIVALHRYLTMPVRLEWPP